MKSVVVTVVGPNRTGIVNELSMIALQHKANWLESHLANLAGQFAGIVRFEVKDADRLGLVGALENINHSGLEIQIVNAESVPESSASELTLDILGLDHPGIVSDISAVLSECGVSIEEMESGTLSGAMSGEQLFKATARLGLPPGLTIDALNGKLQAIADDIMVDVHLDSPPPGRT
ncbi:MAG: glycine cleavage system protein R [Gammaproteobacteria bacterium]|nr:glycine cleavage system protein R [Gammaproteobacteria bacterium]